MKDFAFSKLAALVVLSIGSGVATAIVLAEAFIRSLSLGR